ncbi:MAG: hypothetical protein M3Y27_27780 [Acidobacteriota bacterium]|nr:hypothetical protein [Acidobacteriota bacterium]
MRIKSYFAPSVQSAIGMARKEFGDDVTLVTSHAASLEARHLGDYEVVFAVEEVSDQAESGAAPVATPEPPKLFRNLLQEAIVTTPSTHEGLPEKLEHLRSCFIEIGIEPPMVCALMTMVERCAPLSALGALPALDELSMAVEETIVEPEPVAPAKPRFTPAEMAFVLSVSVVGS